MAEPDLYGELGVSPGADTETINKAFRRKAKKAHPDAGGDPEAFKRLTGAHLVLRDPARRAHYDRTGETVTSGVDEVRQAALSIIGTAVSQALVAENAATQDFVKIVRANLKGMNSQLAAQMRECGEVRKRVERNAKRWRRKAGADGPDVIAAIVASQLVEIERKKAQAEHAVTVHAAAIEILDAYEYEHEAPPSDLNSKYTHGLAGFLNMDIGGSSGGSRW